MGIHHTAGTAARSAFTLIELLIVVAIIAILAAIAVPNFLEAQVRSKTARARADMRSLATGIEAYRIDWNLYPWFTASGMPPRYNEIIYHLIPLTTPTAYLTSVAIRDPFLAGYSDQGYGDGLPRLYYNYRSHESWRSANFPEFQPAVWVLNSIGPDGVANQGLNIELWANGLVAPTAVVVFDPTNGTVSAGDIPRTGGETRFTNQ